MLLAAAAGASVQSELAFHRGVVAFGQQRYDAARAEFEKVLAEDPEDASALHYMGLIAEAGGDLDAAIAYYERVLAVTPDAADVRVDYGSALLEAGRNAEARSVLDAVLADAPERGDAQLFAGIAAYRAGDYAAAIPRLERAGELDAALRLQARYYAGLSAAFLGDLPRAEGAFSDVEEQSPISPLGESARSLREQVQPRRPSQLSLALTAGVEWDSNPTVADGQIGDENGDVRGVWRVRASYRLIDQERYTLTAGYDGFFAIHHEQERVDLQSHVGWASGSLKLDPVTLGLRYDYAYTLLDFDDSYRSLHRVTPSLLVPEADWGATQAYFQWQHKTYLVTNSNPSLDRDGERYTFGFNQFFFLEPLSAYLRFGALGDIDDTAGDDYGFGGFEVSAGGGLSLPFQVDLSALFRFAYRDYFEPGVFEPIPLTEGSKERVDQIYRVTLDAVRPIGEHFEVSASYAFTASPSNIDVFDYDRHVIGGYVTWRY